jgi:predicted ATP-grasp superfamily ATP-dependent carboligase
MRVMVLGAGGPAGIGFCRALRKAGGYHLIGVDLNRDNLEVAEVDERLHGSARKIRELCEQAEPDFVHAQPDQEVALLSGFRHTLDELGVRYYLPSGNSIRICQDKWDSYRIWEDAHLPVPKTYLMRTEADLARRFDRPEFFLRRRLGAGGADSFISDSVDAGRDWINRRDGWGLFTAAEVLPGPTVTVQTLWYEGELLFSQGRSRLAWTHGDRGSALVSETVSDEEADAIAHAAIRAIDPEPHGLWGVDMTRDADGQPRLTEINIGRFFTTVPEFFEEAGCNIAEFYVHHGIAGLVDYNGDPLTKTPTPMINPLEPGLRWIRSMDRAPVLLQAKVLA